MQTKNKFVTLMAFVALATFALAVGCADTSTCDPDQMLLDDLCLPIPPPQPPLEAGTPTADAGATDAETTTMDARSQTTDAASATHDSGTTSADAAAHSESR